MTTIVHDSQMTCLNVVTPHLCGYKAYATSNDFRLNKSHLDESPHTMQITLHFAKCHFSCPELVFKLFYINLLMVSYGMDLLCPLYQLSLDFSLCVHEFDCFISVNGNSFNIWQPILKELCIYHTKYWQLDWCKQVNNLLTRMAAYTKSDSLGDESMLSFNTDTSFWVCDNAATSHIFCKKSLLFGNLCLQSTKSVQQMRLIHHLYWE